MCNEDIQIFFAKHAPSTKLHSLKRRAVNALVRGGIESMDMLCDTPIEKLERIRNLGTKSLELTILMRQKYLEQKSNTDRPDIK